MHVIRKSPFNPGWLAFIYDLGKVAHDFNHDACYLLLEVIMSQVLSTFNFTGSVCLITHFTPGYWDESTTILSWRVILCMLLITVIILTGCSGVHGPRACFDHRFQSSQDHLRSECPPVCGCIQTQCLPVSQEPKRAF